MKAVTYSSYGPAQVLQLRDVPTPVPAPNELLVRVRAVEVTKSDCEMRSLHFAVQWYSLPLRFVLGVSKPKRNILRAGRCAAALKQ